MGMQRKLGTFKNGIAANSFHKRIFVFFLLFQCFTRRYEWEHITIIERRICNSVLYGEKGTRFCTNHKYVYYSSTAQIFRLNIKLKLNTLLIITWRIKAKIFLDVIWHNVHGLFMNVFFYIFKNQISSHIPIPTTAKLFISRIYFIL